MIKNKRLRKSKYTRTITIITLLLTFAISVGYSTLRAKLDISLGARFTPPPTLQKCCDSENSGFRNYSYQIKTINFDDEINIPDTAIETWDVGVNQNGDIMAYIVNNAENAAKYDLHIQGNGSLHANQNMSDWFAGLYYVEEINGLEVLDTTDTTNMSNMFQAIGAYSNKLDLNLGSNFDTSNVTNMSNMFYYAGGYNSGFTLNLGEKFDTSNVTDMSNMFNTTGGESTVFSLELGDKFDTSKVENMSNMFADIGNNKNFVLDLGDNFDTSSVRNMHGMFSGVMIDGENLTLNLGEKFDTSNVTDMSNMFYNLGTRSKTIQLNLGDKFDTSKVENMYFMFCQAGLVSLDLGDKFDTSNVTNMSHMFSGTYGSKNFTLDLGDKFDTSKVTDMSDMFGATGVGSDVYTLDLGDKFDTSNVTNMESMFRQVGQNNASFRILDLGDKFDTSNVTDMSRMFSSAGYGNTNFTINLGEKFDTSNVTNMDRMFYDAGYAGSINCEITIKSNFPSEVTYEEFFRQAASNTKSKITLHYTTKTSDLVDAMLTLKQADANIVKGNLIIDFTGLDIGDEVVLESEKFNVISQNNENITLLAQYNLDSNILQSSTEKPGAFSNSADWEYQPGPKEIDIYQNYGFTQSQLAGYVEYLRQITKNYSISGNLISLQDLKSLGCTISEDYSTGEGFTCAQSPYKSWLVNNQWWWTRSASSSTSSKVWLMQSDGTLVDYSYSYYRNHGAGTRPVITISKNPSNPNEIVSFKIDDTVYNAYENMTWKEWVNSDFNTGDFKIATCSCETGCYDDNDGEYIYSPNSPELVIVDPNNIKINSNDKVSWYDIYTLRKYTYSPTGSLIC